MKQKIISIVLLAAIGFSACKKEASMSKAVHGQDAGTSKKWDETVKVVAQDVAQKLNSVHFRKMLKHEVCLRFDGDANILLGSLIDRLPVYLSYEKQLQTSRGGESMDTLLSLFNFNILQQAAANFPQMQIAVQTDAENWNAATFIPRVVYLPTTFNESTHPTVSGFDHNQQPIQVSSQIDPLDNYVVISQNERTQKRLNDVLRIRSDECEVSALLAAASFNPEVLPEPITPCTGGGGSGGGGGTGGGGTGGGPLPPYTQYVGIGQDGGLPTLVGTQAGTVVPSPTNGTVNRIDPIGIFNGTIVFRKNYRHEKMREIKCDDLPEIEAWVLGAPEIRMHVFEQNVLNPSENLQIFKEEFKPSRRRDIDRKWWDCSDYEMHLWDYVGTGTKASFAYYEYDPVILPNETLQAIGAIVVDLLAITQIIPTGNSTQVAIYGSIRESVQTGIRSLKMKNGVSDYIGKNDYSIFNDEDQYNHSPGEIKLKTWPDL